MTIRDYGITPGRMQPGPRNAITDVPGVTVGHYTLQNDRHNTGVTIILPRPDVYFDRCTAAAEVINGYGKTAGLVQIEELGQLETPIVLTNTLDVGLMYDALVQYTADACAAHGVTLRSVNPVVGECNDGTLNLIAQRVIGKEQFDDAVASASSDFAQGCVGAGTGMICHELKGGIGSASRVFTLQDGDAKTEYHLGVLALCNHGMLEELDIAGRYIGSAIRTRLNTPPREADKGSCILVLATDLPLSARQLKRVTKRCAVGLARCGSFWGHGSGDIAIGFTTAHHLPRTAESAITTLSVLDEDSINAPFAAAAEASEEAVLNALAAAVTTTGYNGQTVHALSEFADLLQ